MRAATAAFGLAILLAVAAPPVSAEIKPQPSLSVGRDRPRMDENAIRLNGPGTTPPPAPATGGGGGDVLEAVTVEAILDIMRGVGVENAAIGETEDKRKLVSGQSQGVPIEVIPYECDGNGCKALNMIAYFGKQDDVPPQFTNGFNHQYIGKLIHYANGNLVLNVPLKLYGGVRAAHIKSMSDLFVRMIKNALEFKPS